MTNDEKSEVQSIDQANNKDGAKDAKNNENLGSDDADVKDNEFSTGFDQNYMQKNQRKSHKIICKDLNGDLIEKRVNKKGQIQPDDEFDNVADYEVYTEFDNSDAKTKSVKTDRIVVKDRQGELVEKSINKKG